MCDEYRALLEAKMNAKLEDFARYSPEEQRFEIERTRKKMNRLR